MSLLLGLLGTSAGAAGGTVYNVSVADVRTVADAITGSLDAQRTLTDTLASADAETVTLARSGAVAEILSASESSIGNVPQTYNVSVTETLAVADAETAALEPYVVFSFPARRWHAAPKAIRRTHTCYVAEELNVIESQCAEVITLDVLAAEEEEEMMHLLLMEMAA